MARRAKKNGQYKVLWARPAYSKQVSEAGRFSAKGDAEAEDIFDKDYKQNQRYGGDELTLECVVQPERTRVVAKRPAHPTDDC